MSKGQNQCFATVLLDDRLMVVGGWIDTIQDQDQTASNAVDFATIDILDTSELGDSSENVLAIAILHTIESQLSKLDIYNSYIFTTL